MQSKHMFPVTVVFLYPYPTLQRSSAQVHFSISFDSGLSSWCCPQRVQGSAAAMVTANTNNKIKRCEKNTFAPIMLMNENAPTGCTSKISGRGDGGSDVDGSII